MPETPDHTAITRIVVVRKPMFREDDYVPTMADIEDLTDIFEGDRLGVNVQDTGTLVLYRGYAILAAYGPGSFDTVRVERD